MDELIRGERSLTIEYRQDGDLWIATSPHLEGFDVRASDLPFLKRAALIVLRDWLDPAVTINEIEIHEER